MSDGYEEGQRLLEDLQPWLDFIACHEGSEFGDYVASLSNTIGCAYSAANYDHALKLVYLAKEIVDDAKENAEDGWFAELVERQQEDWEESQRKPRTVGESPVEAFKKLPR
jgi:hypothetical protein